MIEKELAFSRQEYSSRLENLQCSLKEDNLAAIVITTPENIAYVSGHQTPGYYSFQAAIVPADSEPILLTRYFEEDNARKYSWVETLFTYSDSESAIVVLARALAALGLIGKRIAVEKDSWFLTVRQLEELAGYCKRTEFADGGGRVEALRVIKSEKEIEYIRAACEIGSAAVASAISRIKPGVSECDLAASALACLGHLGCEYWSAPPYICSGPRTALPHATWAKRRINNGEAVYLSISGCVKRYSGVLMRTVIVGDADPECRKVGEAVAAGLNAAINAIKPGVPACDVDSVCRKTIASAGFEKGFKHRTGYSIGLNFPPDWGEGHLMSIRPGETRELRAGMTFHLVPLVFVDQKYGIGLGETVLVSETGCEVLTNHRREVYSVG